MPDQFFDMAFFQNPHEPFAKVRQDTPVYETVLPEGLKVWLVTRYEDVRALHADPRLGKDLRPFFAKLGMPPEVGPLGMQVAISDPPDHTRLRKLANKAFTPRQFANLRPKTELITDRLLDAIADRPEVDLVDALAWPLPLAVVCEMLGVPEAERGDFAAWAEVVRGLRSPAEFPVVAQAMADTMGRVLAAKRAEPADDLMTAMIEARVGEDRFDEAEQVSMALQMVVAGVETVAHLITSGIYALLTHPGQLAALRADWSLLPNAVEEVLRWETPVNLGQPRLVLETLEVGGVTIPEGELVSVSVLSANRDADRFPDPERLDITRQTAGQMAFGHGIHYCLGAPLARMEGEVAFERILRRFPDLSLAVDPAEVQWLPNPVTRGLASLPVRPGTSG